MARLNHDVSPEQLALAFDQLVGVLWLRSSRTLSAVTLDAIFERALAISVEQFPLFHLFQMDHNERRINGIYDSAQMPTKPQLIEAFRYFLVTILTLFGSLTSDALLSGLYQELQTFSAGLKLKEKIA